MSEEERSPLYVNIYSDFDDDYVFRETKYILADLHKLQQENDNLKKQLEEYENEPLTNRISRIDSVVANIYTQNKNQQKEFVNWLKLMSKMYEEEYKDVDVAEHYNCVLAKYKEIIGGENEKI